MQPHLTQRNHDAERGHRAVPRVPDGHGDAPGVGVHDARQLGVAVAGGLVKLPADTTQAMVDGASALAAAVFGPAPYVKSFRDGDPPMHPRIHCPFGYPGDHLWVREAWNIARPIRNSEGIVDDEMLWTGKLPAEDPRGKRLMDDWCVGYAADGCDGRMRPSIHMPRWASRLTLEVTGVRVERLQDISEEDARAEGVCLPEGQTFLSAPRFFAELWESINGKRAPWKSNPLVWVVSFRRITAEERAA